MVFNDTFNNISAISWRSVLFGAENHQKQKNKQVADKHHFMLY
jgi:hypothetical protein